MVENKKMRVVVIGCGSRGKDTYSNLQKSFPESMEIVAAADPDNEKLEIMQKEFGISKENCFLDADDLLDKECMGDIAFICTLDRLHYKNAIKAMKAGYHLLLEKPISPFIDECIEIEKVAKEYNKKVVVCHVLRYTAFYSKIKEIVDSGEIGEIVSLSAIEPVSYWHQAHSFTRGNFRNSKLTSPMILQKCCHDFDILLWMCGKKCERVSSFGSNSYINNEHKPEGAPKYCLDGCIYEETCPYFAPRYYVQQMRNGNFGWPMNMVCQEPTEEKLMKALKNGPYGRCVYQCDNDVVDHQVVSMQIEGGITATLTMCAFTKDSYRKLHIMGTKGEISANMETNLIRVQPFMDKETVINVKDLTDDFSGHAGGDKLMMSQVIDLILNGKCENRGLTTLEQSMASHYAAFAAEESRINNGKCIDVKSFIESKAKK